LWSVRLSYPTSVTLSRNIIKALRRGAFPCYPAAMHRLGPSAAVVLIAALDALSAAAAADCTCRAQSRQFEQGQTACLSTPKGPRLATCGMVLNNSSWEFSETPCRVSGVSPRERLKAQQDRAVDRREALLR
jgi:hypothetical protein